MHAFFKCQILCCGEGNLRCDQTLYNRVVCQVQVHNYVVRNTAFFESLAEEFCYVIFNTHSCENDRKFFIGIITKRSLFYDLSCQTVMWQTISGENRKLLSADQSGQTIDRGNTGTNVVTRIFTGNRVQRQTVYIDVCFRIDITQTIDRLSNTIEGTAEDVQ